jgi:hypothetical protein
MTINSLSTVRNYSAQTNSKSIGFGKNLTSCKDKIAELSKEIIKLKERYANLAGPSVISDDAVSLRGKLKFDIECKSAYLEGLQKEAGMNIQQICAERLEREHPLISTFIGFFKK